MTASEFAFLALGLVLGVASGAALIEVLRARPPVARNVRVTVAPNAIQARMSATLADPSSAHDAAGPAERGPGDRRWREDQGGVDDGGVTGRRSVDRAPGIDASASTEGVLAGTSVPSDIDPSASDGDALEPPLWLRPSLPSHLVAVPMSLEPDPDTAALREAAAASAVAAMAGPGWAGRDAGTTDQGSGGTAIGSITAVHEADADAADSPPSAEHGADPAVTDEPTAMPPAAPLGVAPALDGPCAEERRVADERCAVAARARDGAQAAALALQQAQRRTDELNGRADASAAAANPRTVRAAKEQAQHEFHAARGAAAIRDDVEAAARTWLAEINRINHETRDAAQAAERDRAEAAGLILTLERLAVEADAARIQAERADEACIAARDVVADCDERAALEASRSAASEPVGDAAPGDDDVADPGRIAAATPLPEEEFAFATSIASRAGDDPPILRILRGDRDAMQQAVARLAGDDPDGRRTWQIRLGGLAEALIARSIEATAFDFPVDHAFWGHFSQSQARDIAAALASLGFRFDGFGGWVDERVPSQRDLAMAVGYAGLDPMRIRRWPTEDESRELLREVRVAADEYVAGTAGGMTLGELVTLLGRRADALTEVWNAWGTVRPVLLEAG